MAARSTLGFIHLAGLRLGPRAADWRAPRIKELLFTDLEKLYAHVGPIDVVLLAGELTQTGAAAEFDEVDRFIEQLFECLDRLGSTPTLVAVPGVHDLAAADPYDPVVRALHPWNDDPALRDYVLNARDSQYRARLQAAFAQYTTWDERNRWRTTPRTTGLLPGDSATTVAIGDRRIGVVGLGSAYTSLAGQAPHIDPRQLHAVCDHDAPQWLARHDFTVLLTRHSPCALASQARDEFDAGIDVPGRFVAQFCGGGDRKAADASSRGGASVRLSLPCPPLLGAEGKGGYNAGQFAWTSNEVSLSLFPRRVYRHRFDRAHDNELDDRGALPPFTWPLQRAPFCFARANSLALRASERRDAG